MTAPEPQDPAGRIIAALGLQPHPEGGWFAETFRGLAASGQRPASTAIYFLLRRGEVSHWHRVDADEVWHFYAGDPLELRVVHGDMDRTVVLGPDVLAGQHPQAVVPAHAWQSARPLGAFALVGATVAPGFTFDGFELAPPDWQPPQAR